jgi:ribosomal protein S18 acetylase RimI-like enzyme
MEIHELSSYWCEPLLSFLAVLEKHYEFGMFHPHAFDRATVERLAREPRQDFYCVLTDAGSVLAYGMLRGWDAGFEIPSLGIAVHPDARRLGLARALMHFLHTCALRRGSEKVRLRVHHKNISAIALYRNLGYCFDTAEGDLLVGLLDLGDRIEG